MKIIYFVSNGKVTLEDRAWVERKRLERNNVTFSNGSAPYGFEDSCDAIFLAGNFPLIEKWAVAKGIEIMRPAVEPAKEPEVKQDASNVPDPEEKETQDPKEEVKPRQRRTRKPKPVDDDMV
jgi:hypothetical protein